MECRTRPEDGAGEPVGQELRLAEPQSAAEARRAVEELLAERARPGEVSPVSDALLVATELVTNALRHGGGVAEFRTAVTTGGLRLSVSDRSSSFPRVLPQGRAMTPGGYGWPLIRRLAREIDIALLPDGGKRISLLVPLR
ncbi:MULTISPECIES: ATP-binding protein [Streptomyces]|uniref:Histidine kinase/HSP90-like ATPase domain-containing protein n=1 Tax=Streptomyces albus (strain ATCC 21838 / DSM 41398 / FERM P-419 / JCM 4703 / NBRC 107858) TaxID=1081613 RepID=A0A0B5EF38_STRA4|nr:ATP-binding protein [Streptomyces sp. SCSIO ZS0520]AJE80608.1 hypothetical protein SLNWT_0232 [Streptomyces albus]AOU74921.1 hypothetical protein SLNHY_0230 [Streptomyces albus]AYN30731.1 ATP-binding protein [Streptomyces albus]